MLTRHDIPSPVRETPRPPMEAMLQSLPDRHREIIIATYFQGRTTGDAARALGLAPDTAKARLYHAMRVLSWMVDTYRQDVPYRN
ncbi:sigma factor-like helix-turn-helix DNA-binding protein [Nucisporomicrobium flavum]|jgi:DNA-directed RNA polymerase specialized sigma24 family protein|uniref:sigma factor-like helix-turn-helix DNA-binding protein n=1 Tax=Nucisporomicrobium flavum TaxID=2785915 RepID=UPI001F1E8A11|nr:sigma factor-like helix-turn-helix DNA-binding protein [Nucisporomicrobium flavum]